MINKDFLREQKKEIEQMIEDLTKDAKAIKYDEIGSTGEDNALEFEEFEGKIALSKSAISQLKQLKEALKKIEDGTYGICEKCSLEIEKGRLKAFPASRFCSTHAKQK